MSLSLWLSDMRSISPATCSCRSCVYIKVVLSWFRVAVLEALTPSLLWLLIIIKHDSPWHLSTIIWFAYDVSVYTDCSNFRRTSCSLIQIGIYEQQGQLNSSGYSKELLGLLDCHVLTVHESGFTGDMWHVTRKAIFYFTAVWYLQS